MPIRLLADDCSELHAEHDHHDRDRRIPYHCRRGQDRFRYREMEILGDEGQDCRVGRRHLEDHFDRAEDAARAARGVVDAEEIVLQRLDDHDENGIRQCFLAEAEQDDGQAVVAGVHEAGCEDRGAFRFLIPLE